MRHEEGQLLGVRGVRLYRQTWLPDGRANAAVVIVHGISEHSGRYAHVASHLTERGRAVYALDHRGHGRSGGRRINVDRFDDYIDDLHSLVTLALAEQGGAPLFLLGHSLGGEIALVYALTHQPLLRGLILSGPAVLVPSGVSPLTVAVGRVVARVAPNAGVVALDLEAISRDPAVVHAYMTDPLVHRARVPARLASESTRVMATLPERLQELTLPLLVMHGGADRLVPPDAARLVHARAGSTDKTLRIYDGLWHEIFNEPERATVLAEVDAWIAAHL